LYNEAFDIFCSSENITVMEEGEIAIVTGMGETVHTQEF
jgi:hypothetical protein